jgi:hypothetical protein
MDAKNEQELCDAGLRLAMSILSGLPLEVRFLRTRPNVHIDRVGLHTRGRPSVRAFRSARDRRWDGRRGSLDPPSAQQSLSKDERRKRTNHCAG